MKRGGGGETFHCQRNGIRWLRQGESVANSIMMSQLSVQPGSIVLSGNETQTIDRETDRPVVTRVT